MIDNAQAKVAFAKKWRFWGGAPDEDLFVEFGLTPTQYYSRLQQLLASFLHLRAFDLSPLVTAQLRTTRRDTP
ncbi:DUF3263 domain-containing protein [Rhodococcus opacus]|uniref:DUF3263 domain-containing protein n=1 Tax=Rhodococcus TaxID=1827 RepID=UPI0009EB49B6|nr:DUF3263 domain-containing protein [Rhodococcus sp. 21391]